MQKRYAKKLHNRDQVEVKLFKGWENGYVLGEPHSSDGMIIIPVMTENNGYQTVTHLEIR